MQKVQVRIMNKVILMGRLTRDPEMRNSNGESNTAIARYTLAVDRRYKREGEAGADFISCVAFGRSAEFAEKYFRQGLKVVITGRIQTILTKSCRLHDGKATMDRRKTRYEYRKGTGRF